MSETVSFRCSGELVKFLEQEAERRMTTKSQVAQTLLAEKAREMKGEDTGNGVSTGEDREEEAGASDGQRKDVFERHPDAWYVPDSAFEERSYAVRIPDDAGVTDEGEPRYYKTERGAAEGLRRFYE